MSGVTELGLGGTTGALQLAVGAALFLMPGLAAADRLLGLGGRGWMWAPVFSFTLLPLGAIVLDLGFGVPVNPLVTAALAAGWTLLFARRRLVALAQGLLVRQPRPKGIASANPWNRKAVLAAMLVTGTVGLAVAVHSLPHLPGEASDPWRAYPELAGRLLGLASGKDSPYPIHVDEHIRLAQQAQIDRQGSVQIDDPYTGLPEGRSLFSVSGFREERGFNVAMVQLSHLTGLSLSAEARFVPALQAGLTAGLLYATLAPAPGAIAAAALVGILPTDVRFLGPGYLVPSSFALPWILAGIHVSLRAEGGRRLAALALIETGAFFMHLVPGVLTLSAATVAAALRPGRPSDRLALVGVSLVPLLWLGPLVFQDAARAVSGENELPFQPEVISSAGLLLLALAAAGAGLAFVRPERSRVHSVFAILAMGILASMAASVHLDHHSDATYGRLVQPAFLCIAALAGLTIGTLASLARQRAPVEPRARQALAIAGAALLVVVALAPAVATHLSTPHYRVFDRRSWSDARVLEASAVGPDDRFLADPWQAPVYNAASGARPHAVLFPGEGPAGGSDWSFYLRSNGASQEWFDERGIDYVIGPGPPHAEHEHLGGRVYRILHNETGLA